MKARFISLRDFLSAYKFIGDSGVEYIDIDWVDLDLELEVLEQRVYKKLNCLEGEIDYLNNVIKDMTKDM